MLLLKLKLGVLTVVDSGARQDRGHTEPAREEGVMNRPPLGSDAGAQGNVHRNINTRPHTVSTRQATQDMARLDGTTITILEGPLVGRNVRLVVSVGVGEATQNWPRLDPFQGSRPQHPAGIQKSPMSNSGGKLQDCSQDGAPDATVHQPFSIHGSFAGSLANPVLSHSDGGRHFSSSAPPDMRCVDGSMCCVVCSTGFPKVLACEIPTLCAHSISSLL